MTQEWQPIETAPKDGQLVLLYSKRGKKFLISIGHWSLRERWENENGGARVNPTHWMPLPDAPKEQK